ncbi:MAG: hypothetical protein HQ581_10650 [Planctomycetes bacterium]|nr:hypothetical protein [Planctomycetota bacterium]
MDAQRPKSELFYTDQYEQVQRKIKEFLNGHEEFLSASTVNSTRAVGDAIQDILANSFESLLGEKACKNYSAQFARRAMADLAFEDPDGCYYVIDVKTHRLSTKFNMPNLTSVDRLARFYEDDKNYFVILMVAYDIEGLRVVIREVRLVPIEFFGWDCLTIGALGWGQIQIANSNRVNIHPRYPRKNWMIEMCDVLMEFYPKEIVKINARIERFRKLKEAWQGRPD